MSERIFDLKIMKAEISPSLTFHLKSSRLSSIHLISIQVKSDDLNITYLKGKINA